MPFESQVLQLSPEDLDKFFEAAPDGSPNANTLTVGKDAPIVAADPTTTTVIDNNPVPVVQNTNVGGGMESIPFYNEEDEEPVAPAIEPPKVDANIADPEPAAVKTADDIIEGTNVENVGNIDAVLTNTVDYLVKSGKWVDFEGREDLQITQEVYADLTAKQDEYRLNQMFSELLDSTGDYGKAIITHVKNGGNPDEIIDLFKEQRQLQQIDVTTETGKQTMIEKYYSEILNWKPEKVEKTVKRLIIDDEIDTEFNDVKDLYNEHYKEELAKTQAAVKEQEQQNLLRQETFVNNIRTVLKEDVTLTDQDRRLVQSAILDFKHKLPNGQKVNDFYIKFAEMQADPKQYVEFVRWTMDRENYLNSIKRTEKTKANQEAFNFIKGGAALTKTKSTPIEINANPQKANKGTDFSFALKK